MRKIYKHLFMVLIIAITAILIKPTAEVFAAKAPSLNSKEQYLFLGREGSDTYTFKVKNQQKGWKYSWTSANKSVATVNSKGKTIAKGVGTTKISVKITDSKGKKVNTLSATVIIRDNITSLSITNPLGANELKIGEAYKFKRGFVTESNSTKKTSSITRWTVEQNGVKVDATKATIDDKGNFSAQVPGAYTIVARAFQSKSKYNDWLKDNNKYNKYILATTNTNVTVSNSITSIRQAGRNVLKVEFSGSMAGTDITKVEYIYKMYGNIESYTYKERIKEIKLDSTGKVATITMNEDFEAGNTYKFKYDKLEKTFTVVQSSVKDIKNIAFKDNPIKVVANSGKGVDLTELIVAYNANGDVIYTGKDLANNLRFEYDDNGKYNGVISLNTLYMYTENASATIKAIYTDYVQNPNTGVYESITLETTGVAIATKLDDSIVKESISYQLLAAGSNPSVNIDQGWNNTFTVAKDESFNIYTRFKTADSKEYQLDTIGNFKYEATVPNVVLISGNTVFFHNKGTVEILVTDANKKLIGSFRVNVVDSRTFTTVVPETSLSATISNTNKVGLQDKVEFKFIAKDNLGSPVEYVSAYAKQIRGPQISGTEVPANLTMAATSNNKGEIIFQATAVNAKVGPYAFEVEFTKDGRTIKQVISIQVNDGIINSKPVTWGIDLPRELDLKNISTKSYEVNVYGYNTTGSKVESLVFGANSTNGYMMTVTKNNSLYMTGVQGNIITPSVMGEGTYLINIVATGTNHITGRPNGAPITQLTLTIKDSAVKKVTRKPGTSTVRTGILTEVIRTAFTFELDGKEIDLYTAQSVTAEIRGTGSVSNSYVPAGSYIVVSVTIDGVKYTVNQQLQVN